MKKYFLNRILIFLVIFIGISSIDIGLTLAQDSILENTSYYEPGACQMTAEQAANANSDLKQYCGAYQLNDFIVLGIKIAKIMLGLIGVLAFGAFVYGGVLFLTSAGKEDSVEKGKNTMINAIIGIIIVFSAYLLVQFILQSVGFVNERGEIINQNFKNSGANEWNQSPQ